MKYFRIFLVALLICAPAEAASVLSVPAKTFLSTISVQTHLGSAGYTDLATVESQLQYLGVTKTRDQVLLVANLQSYLQMYTDTGITLSDSVNPAAGDNYASQLTFIRAHPSIFWEIEGCNEPDGAFTCPWNGFVGNAAIAPFQYQLLTDISPLCLQLATPSIINSATFTTTGPLPANRINIHDYMQFGSLYTPYTMLSFALSYYSPASPGRPSVLTESGGWTVPMANGWTQNVQAKYNLDTPFDAYILGYLYTSMYEANDQVCDPTGTDLEFHLGFFDCNNVAKVSATTFHNMTTLLADSSVITPTSLNFTLTNMPANGHSLLLQKSDGTFWLALWNDAQIWNFTTFQEIVVSPVSVTLGLSPNATTVNVYDPYIGTSVQQTASNVSSIVVPVPDHVILVNVIP